jgi:hypothetical protein
VDLIRRRAKQVNFAPRKKCFLFHGSNSSNDQARRNHYNEPQPSDLC